MNLFAPFIQLPGNSIPCHRVGRDLMILYVLDRAASAKVKIINSQHLRNLISFSSSCGRIGQFRNCIFPRKLFAHPAQMSLSAAYNRSSYFRGLLQFQNKLSICASPCKDINMHKRRTNSHPFWEIRLFDELHLPIRVVAHPDI